MLRAIATMRHCPPISLWAGVVVALGASASGADQKPLETPAVAALKVRESRIKEVSAQAMGAVVAITSENPTGTGSGVIVRKDGLILTAAHVTEAIAADGGGKNGLLIIFPDGRRAKGVALGANRTCDAAMVKITEPANQEWAALDLGRSDDVKKGDWVVALGQPGGFDPGRTPPVRAGRIWARDNFGSFYTDCTLIGGDSGGPLLDLNGKVVGIHSSIGGPLSVNRHVAVDNFSADWERLLKGETWGELELTRGDPDRPVIGVELDEQSEPGVKVLRVIGGGPADKAGVRKDDVITLVAGEEVRNYLSFVRLISRKTVGEPVKIGLRRDADKMIEVEIELASRDALRHQQSVPHVSQPPAPRSYLGAEIEEAAPAGALVIQIDGDSPASRAGLRSDDVILQLNGAEVADAVAFAKSISTLPPAEKIKLTIRRAGIDQEVEVTLSER
jgi:serine protease Do